MLSNRPRHEVRHSAARKRPRGSWRDSARPRAVRVVRQTGNFGYTDDSPDGIQEPLLDLSNREVFAPVLVAGTVPPADQAVIVR